MGMTDIAPATDDDRVTLPDCMMPDGADPCRAFLKLQAERDRLRAERDAERERVARWMIAHSYATGHGDTIEDLLAELVGHEREQCAKIAEQVVDRYYAGVAVKPGPKWKDGRAIAAAIRKGAADAERD